MLFGFESPIALVLLPFGLLPLIVRASRVQAHPSAALLPSDSGSRLLSLCQQSLGVLALTGLIIGLAQPYTGGGERIQHGQGAHVVLLVDRSRSMDNTFAGRPPSGDEESKSMAAQRLLAELVRSREHDRFGMAAFSTAPMFVLPLTDHIDSVLAAISAIALPGLAYTDVGRGLLLALSIHESDPSPAPRAVILVSDGAAVISRKVQNALRLALAKRSVNLYWLFLRTNGAKGIFYQPRSDESDLPNTFPERHLHKFFQTLGISYKAFEAENSHAVSDAIQEIDAMERRPIHYPVKIPKWDISYLPLTIAAGALLLLLIADFLQMPPLFGARYRNPERSLDR